MVLPSDSCDCGCRPRMVVRSFTVEGTASRRRSPHLHAPANLPQGSKTAPRGSRLIMACGREVLFAPTSRRCVRWHWLSWMTLSTRSEHQEEAGLYMSLV